MMAVVIDETQVRRVFEEGINQKKLAVFDELFAPNYVNHSMPAPAPGPEGFKLVIEMFLNAFPDMHIEVEQVVCDGDFFSSRGNFTGTHQGDFQGIAPTGKPINIAYIDMWRAENNKMVENWVNLDMVGMMQQLGVMPA
jgi:predicted ester cyclase